MSTTVSYKGATIATVSNDTKTLLTEGKYLEDDITLTDVSGGGAVLTTKNIAANGTYNASSDSADGYSQVNVSVPASAVDTGTKSITANGNNQDVVGYAAVNVNVPNSYSAGDEGKVVSNGALVAQTAHADVTPSTSDQTIDTTLNNSLKVKGDADLVASNIKKDVEIFGVTGSYEGGGGGYSLDDIASGAEPSGALTFTGTTIANYAFERKTAITSISGSNVTTIGGTAFAYCTQITSVNFPNATSIGGSAFDGLQSCVTASIPKATGSPTYLFHDCQKLTTVDISEMTGIGSNAFQQTYVLTTLDCPKVTSIGSNAFYNARVLSTLILRHTSVVTLSGGANAFTNTPMRGYNGGSGTIYVPSSLISSYKSASGWSSIFAEGHVTFSAIEGSIYE